MSESHLKKVDFEFIRYANCWEDADVLLKALQVDQNSEVISIASGGDNCFSLLSEGVKKVVAVDISSVQLYLVELKAEAIRKLSREEFLAFIGINASDNRIAVYESVRDNLSPDALNYWNQHLEEIENGLIHFGKFEQYFQLFKTEFLRSFHNQEIVDGLFEVKSAEAQEEYYLQHWYHEGWKEKHAVFFGEKMLGEKGRDPEFLKHIEGSVAENILSREVAELRSTHAQGNFLLFYILNNRFDEDHLPHYVRKGIYEKVQANLDKLVLHNGLLETALDEHTSCTHFNLSNIFEYMDMELFSTIADDLIKRSASGAKFAYWNFMVGRNMADIFSGSLSFDKDLCESLSAEDMGYFYKGFILNKKND